MKEKNYNSPWSLKFNTAALVLIPAAVGINYIGKLFAGVLKLPLWLDSIGTCLAACLAGPAVGAIAGAANNLIYGLTMDPISYYGRMKNLRGTILTGVLAGLAAVIVSTPLNMMFWGGTTGNLWGDIVYAGALSQGLPAWIASTVDEIVVDLPDKIVVLLLVAGLYRGFPKSILSLYQSNSKIESPD